MIIKDGRLVGCGVMVIRDDGYVLMGRRSDGQGWSFAGGKVDEGESLKQVAKRELYEEFGIMTDKTKLKFLGKVDSDAVVRGNMVQVRSYMFATDTYIMPPKLTPNDEMLQFAWYNPIEILHMDDIFGPSKLAVKLYEEIQELDSDFFK